HLKSKRARTGIHGVFASTAAPLAQRLWPWWLAPVLLSPMQLRLGARGLSPCLHHTVNQLHERPAVCSMYRLDGLLAGTSRQSATRRCHGGGRIIRARIIAEDRRCPTLHYCLCARSSPATGCLWQAAAGLPSR